MVEILVHLVEAESLEVAGILVVVPESQVAEQIQAVLRVVHPYLQIQAARLLGTPQVETPEIHRGAQVHQHQQPVHSIQLVNLVQQVYLYPAQQPKLAVQFQLLPVHSLLIVKPGPLEVGRRLSR